MVMSMFSLLQNMEQKISKTSKDIDDVAAYVDRARKETEQIYDALNMTPSEVKEMIANLTPEQKEEERKLRQRHERELKRSREHVVNQKSNKSKYRLLGMLPNNAIHVK